MSLNLQTAIILHGKPSKEEYYNSNSPAQSNKHWLPWLQRQLILEGILAQTPELPKPYKPDYQSWHHIFEQFEINSDTHLIGHSCGGGFLVRWLSENDVRVGRVALVAPWLDSNNKLDTGFFDFEADPDFTERTEQTAIFASDDDHSDVLESVDTVKNTVNNLGSHNFSDRGHFIMKHMQTEEFPEIKNFLVE